MQNKMKRKNLSFSCSVLLACLISFVSCSPTHLSPSDTITTVISSPLSSLNPIYATDANTQHINDLVHAALLRTNENLVPEPQLAESVRALNKTTWEFVLKKNCHFQNGREIIVDDVEKTIALFADKNNKSPFSENFRKIQRFEKIDRYRFRLHTEKPEAALLSDLTLMKILPAEEYEEKKFQSHPVGAGRYSVIKLSDSEIVLEKFSNGCLEDGIMPKVKIKTVRDDLSKYLKLKNGEVDLVLNELDFRKLETIKADPKSPLAVQSDIGISYNYLGVNLLNSKLRDIRVRRAIALSFDIPTLIHYKMRDLSLPARNLLADANYYANKKIPVLQRNLAEAKRLLNEAGYYNGENQKPPLKISLKTSSNSTAIENGRVLAAQAKEAGIILELRSYDWGIFYNDVKTKNTELFLLRYVGVTDPSIYFEAFHSGEISRNNRTSYKNAEMDKLTTASQNILEAEKRRAIVWKIQELANRDLPFISLWHMMNTVAFQKNIKNVKLYPNGSWETFLHLQK